MLTMKMMKAHALCPDLGHLILPFVAHLPVALTMSAGLTHPLHQPLFAVV